MIWRILIKTLVVTFGVFFVVVIIVFSTNTKIVFLFDKPVLPREDILLELSKTNEATVSGVTNLGEPTDTPTELNETEGLEEKREGLDVETLPDTEIFEKTPVVVLPNETVLLEKQEPEEIFLPDWENVNNAGRYATVNIICTSQGGGSLNPISGSGVFISERGVILTNAHVGQYFLLDKYGGRDFIDCVVRTGSPAYPTYKAELLFISPAWLAEHATDIIKQDSLGTGEHDYALLLVSSKIGAETSIPDKFPFLPPLTNQDTERIGDPVLVHAYPAGFLGGVTIQTSLYLTSSASDINRIFTFSTTSIDLFTLSGNVNAQKGASGGAVVNAQGELSGIVVTSTDAPETGGRNLGAITLSYINKSLEKELGVGLPALLTSDLKSTASEFSKDLKPELSKLLTDVLMGVSH